MPNAGPTGEHRLRFPMLQDAMLVTVWCFQKDLLKYGKMGKIRTVTKGTDQISAISMGYKNLLFLLKSPNTFSGGMKRP